MHPSICIHYTSTYKFSTFPALPFMVSLSNGARLLVLWALPQSRGKVQLQPELQFPASTSNSIPNLCVSGILWDGAYLTLSYNTLPSRWVVRLSFRLFMTCALAWHHISKIASNKCIYCPTALFHSSVSPSLCLACSFCLCLLWSLAAGNSIAGQPLQTDAAPSWGIHPSIQDVNRTA